MKYKIILASNSPRRREICERYGLNPEIVIPKIEEKTRSIEKPYETVMALAFEKANSIANNLTENEIVIAADTIVYHNGEKLGKPSTKEEAHKMLKSLSDSYHSAITGISIIQGNTNLKIIDYVETKVKFKKLTDEIIDRYIETNEPMDKAGAYGIQGWGQLLVEKIDGSYLNIVGLPIEKISDLLRAFFNIELM